MTAAKRYLPSEDILHGEGDMRYFRQNPQENLAGKPLRKEIAKETLETKGKWSCLEAQKSRKG